MNIQKDRWLSECKIRALNSVEKNRLPHAVQMFLRDLSMKQETKDTASYELRIEGLATPAQGAQAVKDWINKF